MKAEVNRYIYTVSLPITTSSTIYAVNDQLGVHAPFVLPSAWRNFSGAILRSLSLYDNQLRTTQIEFYIAGSTGSPTSTDNTALDVTDTEILSYTYVGQCVGADYRGCTSNSMLTLRNLNVPIYSPVYPQGTFYLVMKTLSAGAYPNGNTGFTVYLTFEGV